jgi:hypothetical protein
VACIICFAGESSLRPVPELDHFSSPILPTCKPCKLAWSVSRASGENTLGRGNPVKTLN